jgi:predicted DNA-binding protein
MSEENKKSVNVPVRMPADLEAKVQEASKVVGLSKQDVIRLAIERGLGVLVQQMTGKPVAA